MKDALTNSVKFAYREALHNNFMFTKNILKAGTSVLKNPVRTARLVGSKLKQVGTKIAELRKFRFRNIKSWARATKSEEESLLKNIAESDEHLVRCKRGIVPSICNNKIIYRTSKQERLLDDLFFDAEGFLLEAIRENIPIKREVLTESLSMIEKEIKAYREAIQMSTDISEIRALKDEILRAETSVEKITNLYDKLSEFFTSGNKKLANLENLSYEKYIDEMVVHEYTVNSGNVNAMLRHARSHPQLEYAPTHWSYNDITKQLDDSITQAVERYDT